MTRRGFLLTSSPSSRAALQSWLMVRYLLGPLRGDAERRLTLGADVRGGLASRVEVVEGLGGRVAERW